MPTVEPVFFGVDRRLFAVHHRAQGFLRHEALLIVPPLLNEGVQAHAMLRNVALRASKAGYEVLRFDFAGMGNSAGRISDYSVADWARDLSDAAALLQENAEVDSLSAVSCRYSTLLVEQLSQSSALNRHIAWDPLFDGADWLTSLRASRENITFKFRHTSVDVGHVYQGHSVATSFDDDIASLVVAGSNVARSVAVLSADYREAQFAEQRGYAVKTAESYADWDSTSSQAHVVHDVVDAIVGELK